MLTIDANVFVSARVRSEINHLVSDLFLNRVVQAALKVYCPTLAVPETAAAIARPGRGASLAHAAAAQIETFPRLTLVEITPHHVLHATHIAVSYGLRGGNAVYVAVAQEFGTTLVTWDAELLARGVQAIPVLTPAQWLSANPTV